MDVLSIKIVWCDVSFEKKTSYQTMQNEFNETTTGITKTSSDEINMRIFDEGKAELHSNDIPLVTVRTCEEATKEISERGKKVFVICSGTVGRFLLPQIVTQYPQIHKIYIYAHGIDLYDDLEERYPKMLRMFNFHTNLLLRLTRDISLYFIERGKAFLEVEAPREALQCFNHARKLEIAANVREKTKPSPNSTEPSYPEPDFRDHLDLLEGDDGLIYRAGEAVRAQGHSLETS